MENSVYQINKGINRAIEFKGLKAQYIWYLGGGIVVLMIIYAIMYFIGVNTYISILVILVVGAFLLMKIYAMSSKYGEFGLTKAIASKSLPKVVKTNSRAIFIELGKEK
uniref:DUF4133 domain-containing protein n=1 Tax=Pedobacter schmidteae TaxID=2201271 RepID=UPI000EB30BCA|nr:DUF4133 domain-containing protein [Pedobacter schmidteae]